MTTKDHLPNFEQYLDGGLGHWHARTDQIEHYFSLLADNSPCAILHVIGRSVQQRSLQQLIISSQDNVQQLETLRQRHLQASSDGPLVIWLAYSVHGGEASGAHAAALTAYELLSSSEPWVKELLSQAIIIIDPLQNPDGYARFVGWANGNRGRQASADHQHRRRLESNGWGRVNHYGFDLNRDWLIASQPESHARLKQYYHWQPHVLADFHEYGWDGGYFYYPGVADQQNPQTSTANIALVKAFARRTADTLDRQGQPHVREEVFDAFFPGLGSVYPNITGAIGLLYEQPGVMGHSINSRYGKFSLLDSINNHHATSLATLETALAEQQTLKQYRRDFLSMPPIPQSADDIRGWVFADDGDPDRVAEMIARLQRHQIASYPLIRDLVIDGLTFTVGHSWVVPRKQRQQALIYSLFSEPLSFSTNNFYDASAWTIPHAFNLPFAALTTAVEGLYTATESINVVDIPPFPTDINHLVKRAELVAYTFPGHRHNSLVLAIHLLNLGIRVCRVGEPQYQVHYDNPIIPGDFILPLWRDDNRQQLELVLEQALKDYPVPVSPVNSGHIEGGHDLGSFNVQVLKPVKPMLVAGEGRMQGVEMESAGHHWHYLDNRLRLAVTLIDSQQPAPPDLSETSHLLITDMQYQAIPESWIDPIKRWLHQGGVMITERRSAQWAEVVFASSAHSGEELSSCAYRQQALAKLTAPTDNSFNTLGYRPYNEYVYDSAESRLGGAIFKAELDLTHPLALGYQRAELPVYLAGLRLLQPGINAYNMPLRLKQGQPIAGHASKFIQSQLAQQPLLVVDTLGKGLVIKFAFNPVFRDYWKGTEGLLANALLNSGFITDRALSG